MSVTIYAVRTEGANGEILCDVYEGLDIERRERATYRAIVAMADPASRIARVVVLAWRDGVRYGERKVIERSAVLAAVG